MKIKYSYTTIYNYRPGEQIGHGKEPMTFTGESTLSDFAQHIEFNSSIKFETNIEFSYCLEKQVVRDDWNDYIGQPMYFITDVKIEILDWKA